MVEREGKIIEWVKKKESRWRMNVEKRVKDNKTDLQSCAFMLAQMLLKLLWKTHVLDGLTFVKQRAEILQKSDFFFSFRNEKLNTRMNSLLV